MKGVILAGGKGTRLYPLTKVTNKHLLPVYDKPMIYYPIETLTRAGIRDILIVSGRGHAGHFLELLESGREFDANFSYAIQEEAGGIAQALAHAEDFSDREKIIVMLGDNILEDDITPAVAAFQKQSSGARIFLKEVKNPRSYGIAEVQNGKVVCIEEKPETPKSNLAVIGLYMYDGTVFDIIKTVEPSHRGELEITDVNNAYINTRNMYYEIVKGWWGAGGESFDSLLHAAVLVSKNSARKNEGG